MCCVPDFKLKFQCIVVRCLFSLMKQDVTAKMIQVGTHKHYDTPPNVPMFGISAKAGAPKGTNLGEALSSVAEGLMRVWKKPSECSCSSQTPPRTPTDSPASCATVRSQYISTTERTTPAVRKSPLYLKLSMSSRRRLYSRK